MNTKMKMNQLKKAVLSCMIAILSLQSAALAQVAYSITDNNQDGTSRRQQLYRINIPNGNTNFIAEVVGPTGQRIIREYEGLASIGSTLYGVSEFAGLTGGGVDCNTGDDPVTGLSSDIRTFKVFPAGDAFPATPSGQQQLVPSTATPVQPQVSTLNGQNASTNIGIQIGETCINADDSGTEAAMGYNQGDGYLWAISSDDLFPATGIRSRLYRVSPTTGRAQRMCYIDNADFAADGGDRFPYLDGMTIFPSGAAFGTEARFSFNLPAPNTTLFGGLYSFSLPLAPVPTGVDFPSEPVGACESVFVKHLLPVNAGQDTGLAHSGNNLFILFERGLIYQTSTLSGGAVIFRSAMSTPGATNGAGGGDTNGFAAGGVVEGPIEGCRGGVSGTGAGSGEFQANTDPTTNVDDLTIGGCRDFEGFDVPVPAGR